MEFKFDQNKMDNIFPFYIQIDSSFSIKSFGKNLLKICPQVKDSILFDDCFYIFKPQIINLTFKEINSIKNQLILIKCKKSDLILRGQFEILENSILFLGSPWFNSMNELVEKKLTIQDFALHDPLIDLLHILNNQENTSNELKEVLKTLNKQKNKLKKDKEELNRLSLVASLNENGILFTEPNGQIFWSNNAFFYHTGFTKEKVFGKNLMELGIINETNQKLSDLFNTDAPFEIELILNRKNQSSFWAKLKGQPIFNEKGIVKQFFLMLEDISKAKISTIQIKESENRLASLVINLDTAILLEDENRKILLANKKFCSLFNLDLAPEDLIGMDCTNSAEDFKILFNSPNEFVKRIDILLKNRKEINNEVLNLVDGRVFERNYIPIFNDEIYNGHLWTYTDVTLQKRYNENLQIEKEKYRSIIANMNLGLIEVDKNDIITMANQSFSEMSNFSMEELIGKKASSIFLHTQEDKDLMKNKEALRKKGTSDSYEIKVLDKYGKQRNWLVSGASNYNSNGKIIGSIGIHLDITGLKELELQREYLLNSLAKSNNELEDYAAIVSHDLKSPLQSIHSLITWIKEDNDKEFNTKTKEYLSLIERKVEKMHHLISGILTYSKIDKIGLSTEKINTLEVIQNSINIIHVPEHIEVSILNKLPIIEADRYRIHQLFQNIISNAVNFIDKPKGSIKISCKENKNHYIFSISDNGQGIAKENQEKIFKIFQSIGKHKQSTGLGLSIVKKIIDTYKGEIWFESKVNVGTTFFIKLKKVNNLHII
jgi:PAS domain S-box-containing protein